MASSKQYVFGLHAVDALLNKQPERVIRLCVFPERNDKKLDALVSLAKKLNIPVDQASRQELDRMTLDANHQGVVAYCSKSRTYDESNLKQLLQDLTVPPFVLLLDGVQDPHNLGACFRSADAAGVHAIIAPKIRQLESHL